MIVGLAVPFSVGGEGEEEIAAGSHSSPGDASAVASAQMVQAKETKTRIRDWLARMGLGDTNPFEKWDAGKDPNLSQYLVDHDLFPTLWRDRPTILYAPAGGGKSAFRVRLSWACRVQEDGRRVFAINYLAPDSEARSLADHLPQILKRAARDLLLTLVHRPTQWTALNARDRQAVRSIIDQNDPGLLGRFLVQVERAGSIAPLAQSFDPSASQLTAPPEPSEVRALCKGLRETPAAQGRASIKKRFEELLHVMLDILQFEAIYLLVDGVDAWMETQREARKAVAVLRPLLRKAPDWADRHLYLKLFLPRELEEVLPEQLTKSLEAAIIEWDLGSLAKVLKYRLAAASKDRFKGKGRIDSLDAISDTSSLRGAEKDLLGALGDSPTPRELIVLMDRVIFEHVRHESLDEQDEGKESRNGRLEHRDVEAAISWYLSSKRTSSH